MVNKKSIYFCLVMSALFFLTGCDEYQEQVQNKLKIKHVFSRPSTAYGPGSIVLYTKDTGYTNTCYPEWTIGKAMEDIRKTEYKEDSIADLSVKKTAELEFDIKLDANERGKIGSKYEDISKVKLTLDKGKQFELKTPIQTIYDNAKNNSSCSSNMKLRYNSNPDGKFYLVIVAYAYNMDYSVEDKAGLRIDGEIPAGVLKILSAKAGIKLEANEEFKLQGENLFIGFNGDIVPSPKEGDFTMAAKDWRKVKGDDISATIKTGAESKEVLYLKDITDVVRKIANYR